MKFKVEKLPQAEVEIESLEESQQELLRNEYSKIETNELRSLFKYTAGKIIVIGVIFVKKTQKTPKDKIKLAMQRLKEV